MKYAEFSTVMTKVRGQVERLFDQNKFCQVLPVNKEGAILPAIVPGCLLYIACGEDTLVCVNETMVPEGIVWE